jgi:hypothetical protein
MIMSVLHYLEQGDSLLIALVAFHLDINIHALLLKADLGVFLVFGENAKDDMSRGLVPIISAVNQFFLLALFSTSNQ